MPSRHRSLLPVIVTLALPLLAGCGSKVSEANYYKVSYGMDEAAVDDLLGPAHAQSPEAQPAATSPSTARAPGRKTKTWSRGPLTFSVVFEDGKVVARSAEGIPFEGSQRRPPATRASGV